MESYITFYTGEIRAIQIYLRDQNDDDFVPTSASTYVQDVSGGIIQPETTAMTSGAAITTLIGTNVTNNSGKYEIVWNIWQNTYLYKHKTNINVQDL